MKLLTCKKCLDIFLIWGKHTRICVCGNVAGKYLDDGITAVINKDAVVFGIDSNGFNLALHLQEHDKMKFPNDRIDRFFTGWIPNHPGEVIIVDTIQDVVDYPYEMKEEDKVYTSTLPTIIAEENEKEGIG